jgi:hypothetical protein
VNASQPRAPASISVQEAWKSRIAPSELKKTMRKFVSSAAATTICFRRSSTASMELAIDSAG